MMDQHTICSHGKTDIALFHKHKDFKLSSKSARIRLEGRALYSPLRWKSMFTKAWGLS